MKRSISCLALAALGLGLLAACATPIGVRRIDERSVHRTLTADVLSVGEPSVPSRQVLLRLGLFDRYEDAPEAALAALHARTLAETNPSRLFALAEYSFHHAERGGGRPYYVAASLYAYAFLFPERDAEAPHPFDPRLRTAVDVYNRSIAAALVRDDGEVALREGVFDFHLGSLRFQIDPRGFRWADRRLASFVSAAELDVRGLRNRYRRAGIGAPFVANAVHVEGETRAVEQARLASNVRVPVTFFVRHQNVHEGLRTGSFRSRLEIYSLEAAQEIEVAGRRVPLEYETTSALAYLLDDAAVWDFALRGFLRGDLAPNLLPRDDGLFMLRPYVPGRVPVVLVHGTASSPARWAELLNELESDPRLADRIQVWAFIYTTGNPILYSAGTLRRALRSAVEELGGPARDPALGRMVVVGHSQGGLLTKLQVIESGDRFWSNLTSRPFEEVELQPETRALVGRLAFFEPLPFIERVIFISTPHRGSYLAANPLGRLASRLFRAPQDLVARGADLARAGADLGGTASDVVGAATGDEDAKLRRELSRIPSSVDNMNPGHRFSRTIASIPVPPQVQAHSIVPVTGGPPPAGQNDGVVAYESAHIEEAVSEYVVFESGHSTQSHPETIQEVRRILLEHLGDPRVR